MKNHSYLRESENVVREVGKKDGDMSSESVVFFLDG